LHDLVHLDTPRAQQEAMNGAVEDWATQSLIAARQAYCVLETSNRLRSDKKLPTIP
jgi:hypothetical protein